MHLDINSEDFLYNLPEERIAKYPLEKRDQAKLLVYNKGTIDHKNFSELPELLPKNATLFFNNTKVIAARLQFQKGTGAHIEVFLLNPIDPDQPVGHGMQSKSPTTWRCTIGNLKRWKEGTTVKLEQDGLSLTARLINTEEGTVEFEWSPDDLSFGEVVGLAGSTPLPPYLKRKAEASDRERYQTVYSAHEGAVAAPTAGLHFSEMILAQLLDKGLHFEFLTLHVSAGTFQPIKTKNAFEHPMHSEQLVINRKNVESLLSEDRKLVAVGTTTMRTLESIYWYGVKLLKGGTQPFVIHQMDPYDLSRHNLPSRREAIESVLSQFDKTDQLLGETSIFIVPGYQFQVCEGLITNFHQPGSTLMLLVAAFLGPDWRQVYKLALEQDYRFLSYGDSSLLFPG